MRVLTWFNFTKASVPMTHRLKWAIAALLLTSPMPALSQVPLDQQLAVPVNNRTLTPNRQEADRLAKLGKLQELDGFVSAAIASWSQSLRLYRAIGDLEGESLVAGYLATAYLRLGQVSIAETLLREQLAATQLHRNVRSQVYALNSLGQVVLSRGDAQEASSLFQTALALATRIEDANGQALSYANLGQLAIARGQPQSAYQAYTDGLAASRKSAQPTTEALLLNHLGDWYMQQPSYSQALSRYEAALRLTRQSRDRPNQYRAIDGMVAALLPLNRSSQAIALLQERIEIAQLQGNLPEELKSFEQLGTVQQQRQEFSLAQQSYQRALAIAQDLRDSERANLLQTKLAQLVQQGKR
jgi:tetratricopeptide (TPR) repeat protein